MFRLVIAAVSVPPSLYLVEEKEYPRENDLVLHSSRELGSQTYTQERAVPRPANSIYLQ